MVDASCFFLFFVCIKLMGYDGHEDPASCPVILQGRLLFTSSMLESTDKDPLPLHAAGRTAQHFALQSAYALRGWRSGSE